MRRAKSAVRTSYTNRATESAPQRSGENGKTAKACGRARVRRKEVEEGAEAYDTLGESAVAYAGDGLSVESAQLPQYGYRREQAFLLAQPCLELAEPRFGFFMLYDEPVSVVPENIDRDTLEGLRGVSEGMSGRNGRRGTPCGCRRGGHRWPTRGAAMKVRPPGGLG